MIQGSVVRAVMGREDALHWPIKSVNSVTSPTGITRCVIICKKDGETDVVIDSSLVPLAFSFAYAAAYGGKDLSVIRWKPGIAIGGQFTESGIWKCAVFLYDAVHTSGVWHGEFLLDVVWRLLDPYFSNVILLAMTNDPLTDYSPIHHALTIPAKGVLIGESTAVFPFTGGGTVGDFSAPGSSPFNISELDVPANAVLNLNVVDVTIELFFYIKPGSRSLSWSSNSVLLYHPGINGVVINLARSTPAGPDRLDMSFASVTYTTGAESMTPSVWRHLAITRSAGMVRMFIDGTKVKEQVTQGEPNSNGPITVGGEGASSYNQPFIGYMSNLRITKNVARYVSDFTPPNAPFPLQ